MLFSNLMSDNIQTKYLADALNALAFTISDMINERLQSLTAVHHPTPFRPETDFATMRQRSEIKTNEPEGLLVKSEVAQILHVTPRCIDNWMEKGLIPYYKIGRSVRFRMTDVQSCLNDRFRIDGGLSRSRR